MAKKTRTIIVKDEAMEKRIYDLCDRFKVKDKNIATTVIGEQIYIDIYSSSKKFDNIAFKLGGLGQYYF